MYIINDTYNSTLKKSANPNKVVDNIDYEWNAHKQN